MRAQLMFGALAGLLLLNGCGGNGGNSTSLPTRYAITDLGDRFSSSSALGLNSTGIVVGEGVVHNIGSVQPNTNAQPGQNQPVSFLYDGNVTPLNAIGLSAVNDSGVIVGSSGLYQNGTLKLIPSLATTPDGGVISLSAAAINNQGQIAGFSGIGREDQPYVVHAVLYANGQATDLGVLGATSPPQTGGSGGSRATSINNQGQIVGVSATGVLQANGVPVQHAFVWQNGKMSDLGTLGSDYSSASAINNNGLIVGKSVLTRAGAFHAVYWQNGQIHDMDSAGLALNAQGVNDSGQIVGQRQLTPVNNLPRFHAYVYQNGQFTDLNTRIDANSGWELIGAKAINNSGQICGTGNYKGAPHAYLLTPLK